MIKIIIKKENNLLRKVTRRTKIRIAREKILEQKLNKNFKIKEMVMIASKNKKIMYTF